MSLKQRVIFRKLEQRKNALADNAIKFEEFLKRKEFVEAEIESAETDEEIAAAEKEIDELEDEKEQLEKEKTELEDKIEGLQTELDEVERKKPKLKEGKREMGQEKEQRAGINEYVRSKSLPHHREQFTSIEGGALIPEQLMPLQKEKVDEYDLTKYVHVIPVNRPSGSYPVISKSGGKFVTVEELKKNPELAVPKFTDVDYKVATYRGYIPVSQEAIDDAEYDVTGIIAEDIKDQELNTKNEQIAEIFKTATPKPVQGLDGIITLFNTGFKRVYNVKAFVTSSLYNELDLMKDENGRYLLQDDITVASGKRLKGKEVVVLDDDVLGDKVGDLKGFIGDSYEFVKLFDRKRASVKWVDHDIYGQLLAGFVRFQTKAVDTDAGYYITFTPDAEDEGNETP